MSAIGRKTEHAGQTTITLSGLHADFANARDALMRVSAMLQSWTDRAAEKLKSVQVWQRVCDHLKQILATVGPSRARRRLDFRALGIA